MEIYNTIEKLQDLSIKEALLYSTRSPGLGADEYTWTYQLDSLLNLGTENHPYCSNNETTFANSLPNRVSYQPDVEVIVKDEDYFKSAGKYSGIFSYKSEKTGIVMVNGILYLTSQPIIGKYIDLLIFDRLGLTLDNSQQKLVLLSRELKISLMPNQIVQFLYERLTPSANNSSK